MTVLTRLLLRLEARFGPGHGEKESGNSLVEYALLLALIVVVCVVAVTMIAEQTQSSLSSAASHL